MVTGTTRMPRTGTGPDPANVATEPPARTAPSSLTSFHAPGGWRQIGRVEDDLLGVRAERLVEPVPQPDNAVTGGGRRDTRPRGINGARHVPADSDVVPVPDYAGPGDVQRREAARAEYDAFLAACPSRQVLARISDKWVTLILARSKPAEPPTIAAAEPG